jgi:hypothetical protein
MKNYKCCCCFHYKRAAIIIGIIDLLGFVLFLAMTIYTKIVINEKELSDGLANVMLVLPILTIILVELPRCIGFGLIYFQRNNL